MSRASGARKRGRPVETWSSPRKRPRAAWVVEAPRIAGTRGRALNVFRALLNSPDTANAVAGLGEYIRYNSALDPAIRETAILATARELGAEYEWAHHEPIAREVGAKTYEDLQGEALHLNRDPHGRRGQGEGVFGP